MKRTGLSLLIDNEKCNAAMDEFILAASKFRDKILAIEYKSQSDDFLLSRGKKSGVDIGTSGKSETEIFGVLSDLQKNG